MIGLISQSGGSRMKMNRFVLCALTCVFSWTLICAADEPETENYAKEFYFRDGVSWGYDEECLNWDLGDGTTLTLTNMSEDDDAGLIMYNKDIIAKNMAPAEEPETFNSEGL